jgi:hypothetical protein
MVAVAALFFSGSFPAAPADRTTVPAPAASDTPLQDPSPEGESGHGSWPDVTVGGSLEPYVDHESGEESYLVVPKAPVVHGLVNGIQWTVAGYVTNGADQNGVVSGSCGDLFLGAWGGYGGVSFCARTPDNPATSPMSAAGFGTGYDTISGPVSAYAGLVDDRVSTVVLRMANGRTVPLELRKGPPGTDARYFVAFVPNGTLGAVVALDDEGRVVAREPLCLGHVAVGTDNVACGDGVAGTYSVVRSDRS